MMSSPSPHLLALLLGLFFAVSGCLDSPDEVRFEVGEPRADAGDDAAGEDSGVEDAAGEDAAGEDAATEDDVSTPEVDAFVPDSGGEPDADPPAPLVPIEPIPGTEGILISTFTTMPESAFDGETEQVEEKSASTTLYFASPTDLWLGKDWRCTTQVRKVEVYEPDDGPFITDEENYPDGGAGTAHLLGRQAGQTAWTVLAEVPFEASNPSKMIVFAPELLDQTPGIYVSHAVSFTPEGFKPGTLQVAEIVFFGGCAGPESVIDWQISDWECRDVTCEQVENHGGVNKRTVNCLRDNTHATNEALCPQPKPADTGAACSLSCPYELIHIGYRPFTYANGSGWLHEGNLTLRAGPLPHGTSFGTTVEAIAGKPCSIETTTASTYYAAISCKNGDDYCAFRCQ